MGRGKLKLELIANEKIRKTTFQKRKKGILKKAKEFSVLCGIDICLFISGPKLDNNNNNNNNNNQPTDEVETWPSESSKVMELINKYQATIQRKPPKKVYSLADIFFERKKKIEAEILRCRKQLYEAKYPTSPDVIEHFSCEQLKELIHRLEGKIDAIRFVIDAMKENELRKKNQSLALVSTTNNTDKNHLQRLLDQIPQSNYLSFPMISTALSSNDMQYSTTTTTLQDPVFTDPMAGIQRMGSIGGPVFDNPAAKILRMGPCMGRPNYVHYYNSTDTSALPDPVFADPTTAGTLLGNMNMNCMTMFCGGGVSGSGDSTSTPVQAQYYSPLQVQPPPPMVPYIQMQYPMNVMNLARRIGGPMSQVRFSSGGTEPTE